MALQHDADDALVARRDLPGDLHSHLGLLLRVLTAVAVAEVDHEPGSYAHFGERLARCVHARGVVIGAGTAAQNDMAVLVTARGYDGGMPTFGNREKVMRRPRCADGIHSNLYIAVGAVLETDRAGQSGCEL